MFISVRELNHTLIYIFVCMVVQALELKKFFFKFVSN